jgi:Asp-tRNA(Asn)/Glu-tRNA(Gln) amidotransferase B subunit
LCIFGTQIDEYRSGDANAKKKRVDWLLGQVIKMTEGRAQPHTAKELATKVLEKASSSSSS